MNIKNYLTLGSMVVVMFILAFVVHLFERASTDLTPSWYVSSDHIYDNNVYEKLQLKPIFNSSSNMITFRFWMTPSWGKSSVISVYFENNQASFDVKQFLYTEENSEPQVIIHFTKKLDSGESLQFIEKVKDTRFLWEKPNQKFDSGPDGWIWTVEANIRGRYIVDSQWASTSGPLYDIGKLIIETSGVEITCYGGGC